MLLLTEVDLILKKEDCKLNLVWPGDSNGGKVIFILLIEVIRLNMGLTAIDIRGLGLEFILG